MFKSALAFNAAIGGWDVTAAVNTEEMFSCLMGQAARGAFNANIGALAK